MSNKSTKKTTTKTGFVGGTAFAIIIAFAIVASFRLAKEYLQVMKVLYFQ